MKKIKDYIVQSSINLSMDVLGRFDFAYKEEIKKEKLMIPYHLHKYVKRNLKIFINNAQDALLMEEGVEYLVEMSRIDDAALFEPKIVLIDKYTGLDLPNTQWSNGLQQFLQLKHGLRLTPITLKAVFVSNSTYFASFTTILGLSGTLGNENERKQLSETYDVVTLNVPSSIPRLFYEEMSIMSNSKQEWYLEIFEAIEEKFNLNRSVLIICESIKQVKEINTNIKSLAKNRISEENQKLFFKPIIYSRHHESFIYAEGIPLPSKTLIYSTTLVGRGTHITLSPELQNSGGLHVIITFLPENSRIEEQAFGRAARSGDSGTGQLIFHTNEEFSNVSRLKHQRDLEEHRRSEKRLEYLTKKVNADEVSFEEFELKYKEIKNNLSSLDLSKEDYALVLRDVLDQWAMILDVTHHITDNETKRSMISELCEALTVNCNNTELKLTQPLNVLNYAIRQIKYKNRNSISTENDKTNFTKNKTNFEVAEEKLLWLMDKHSYYAPEANYYLACLYILNEDNITKGKNEVYQKISKTFLEARKGFEKRLLIYFSNMAIVEFYKNDKNQWLKSDIFCQQQMALAQTMMLFIESIDEFLGKPINTKSFVTSHICEEASCLLFQHFSATGKFQEFPIKTTKVSLKFDEEIFKKYCDENNLNYDELNLILTNAKTENRGFTNKDFEKINIPTAELFWSQLLKHHIISEGDIQKHWFVNTSKFGTLNFYLVKTIEDCYGCELSTLNNLRLKLFKNAYLLSNPWKELNYAKLETKITSDGLEILRNIGAICCTESAEIKCLKENFIFDIFGKLKRNDLLLGNIPVCDIDMIWHKIQQFIESIILNNSNWEKLEIPKCYMEELKYIINRKMAFSIAYCQLKVQIASGEQPIIPFQSNSNISIFEDLINLGILEGSNVNLKPLKELSLPRNLTPINIKAAFQGTLKSKEAAESVSTICNNSMDTASIKPYNAMAKADIEILYTFIKNAPAQQIFDTLNIKFISLRDRLDNIKNSYLMKTYSASNLVSFHEKKWSQATLERLSLASMSALIQIIIGGTIVLTSGGMASIPAKIFFSQAISDLMYAVKGFSTGYASSYLKHKLMSIVLNIPFWTSSFIQADSITNSNIVKSLLTKVASSAATVTYTTTLETITKGYIENIVKNTKKKFMDEIRKQFNELSENEKIIWSSSFENKEIIEEALTKICDKNIENFINEYCDLIYFRCRNLFINLRKGLSDGTNRKNQPNFVDNFEGAYKLLKVELEELKNQPISKFGEQLKVNQKNFVDQIRLFSNPTDNGNALLINCIKDELEIMIDKALEEKVNRPLLSLIEEIAISDLQKTVAESFASFKDTPDLEKLHYYETTVRYCRTNYEIEEAKIIYNVMALGLMKTTKNSDVIAQLILEGFNKNGLNAQELMSDILSSYLNQSGTLSDAIKKINAEKDDIKDDLITPFYDAIMIEFPQLSNINEDEIRKVLADKIKIILEMDRKKSS